MAASHRGRAAVPWRVAGAGARPWLASRRSLRAAPVARKSAPELFPPEPIRLPWLVLAARWRRGHRAQQHNGGDSHTNRRSAEISENNTVSECARWMPGQWPSLSATTRSLLCWCCLKNPGYWPGLGVRRSECFEAVLCHRFPQPAQGGVRIGGVGIENQSRRLLIWKSPRGQRRGDPLSKLNEYLAWLSPIWAWLSSLGGWVTAATSGAIAAWLLTYIRDRFNRPKLEIEVNHDLGSIVETDTRGGAQMQKHARLIVRNTGRTMAKNCCASIDYFKRGTEYSFRDDMIDLGWSHSPGAAYEFHLRAYADNAAPVDFSCRVKVGRTFRDLTIEPCEDPRPRNARWRSRRGGKW